MTTISTYLAASLVAVTFGWVPSERANESQPSEGYDYLVKLSPEDLEALRDGRAVDLVSELPDDVRPIERVRVYVGEGEAPQQLRERDRLSPQRIIAGSTAQPYKVAKPVTPEWKDAATLETDEANDSDTTQRHTTYQNPNALQEGFAQATRPLNEVGQVLDTQARNLADNTAQLFQQGGDEIRRGVQNLANGTSRTLESLVPNAAATPYTGRPKYDEPSLVTPPDTSTALSAPQQTQFSSPLYPNQNNLQQNYPQQSNPAQGQFSPPTATNFDTAPQNNRLVERFTDDTNPDYAATRRTVTPIAPVPRGDIAASDYSNPNSQTSSQTNPWAPDFNAAAQTAQRPNPAFPDSQAPFNNGSTNNTQRNESLWSDTFGSAPNTQTGGGFASDHSPVITTPVANTGGASNTNNTADTGWGGRDFANRDLASPPATPTVVERDNDTDFVNHLLMVLLGAATCWTWIAYIDVRNKYLSVLRAAPGSGYSNAA